MVTQSRSTRRHRSFPLLAAAAAGALLFIMTDCKMIRLHRDLGQMAIYGALSGRVSNLPPAGTTAYILVLNGFEDDPQLVEWERVQDSGLYFLMVLSGTGYQVVAFADLNGDRRWEPGEPIDIINDVTVEPIANVEVTLPVRLSLHTGVHTSVTVPPNLPLEVPGDITREQTGSISLGEIANLDDGRFSAEAGKTGLWEPYKFLKTYGLGIFFVEAYDPAKIPVLFIYGAEGSPQDWRYIMEHLDRTRFQPWFFHYATGIRLENWSMGLNSLVKRLHARYPFKKLFVVAHSMGGLVARDFILRNTLDDHQTYIARFVTISTPWEGHRAAAAGVRMPVVVPSWNDIEPNSSYLTSLFQRRLPSSVAYYLIFGYKHSTRLWLPADNDGVVGVASELSLQAQAEARKIFGLNLDHNAILAAPETLQKLEEYLSD